MDNQIRPEAVELPTTISVDISWALPPVTPLTHPSPA